MRRPTPKRRIDVANPRRSAIGVHFAIGIHFAIRCAGALLAIHGDALADSHEKLRGPLQLITAEEAKLPINTNVSSRIRPPNRGPQIEINRPTDGGRYPGTFPIDVVFSPGENGLAVDMNSLKVEYKRAWGIDITSRIHDYVDFVAKAIKVDEAELPIGRHTVEILISDTEENRSSVLFTVIIEDR